jgi:hypothetical protein
MVRGTAKLTVSHATVVEAMQECARVNFLAGHIPKVVNITAQTNGSYGGKQAQVTRRKRK